MNPYFTHYSECCKDYIDTPSHARPGIHTLHNRLYVCTVIFNPLRFRSRYWNYDLFQRHIEDSGAILYTAEVALGEREFEITEPSNPRHLQLRAKGPQQEIWLKECALNLLINRLPPDCKYLGYVDADVKFTRPDWASEILQELQRYYVIQPFSSAVDLGPNYEIINTTPGYVYQKYQEYIQSFNPNVSKNNVVKNNTIKDLLKESMNKIANNLGLSNHALDKCMSQCMDKAFEDCFEEWDKCITKHYKTCAEECGYYYYGKKGWIYAHPGYSWFFRKEAIDWLGGLIDWCIGGSGDWVMACCLMEEVKNTINPGYSENYKKLCYGWEEKCKKYIRKNVGYIPGTINHYFHGKKLNRNYDSRWKLLVETKFDPLKDIKRDWQGLWQLEDDYTPRSISLREGLRRYAKIRDEDNPNL